MDQEVLEKLLRAQQSITEMVSSGASLPECLEEICSSIEQALASKAGKSSILLLKGNNLHHGAAPSLPKAYCDAVNGVEIGESVGSCGTAAFTKRQVIVADIATDPLWADFKGLALPHNLVACWSTPIVSSTGEVLGTFAIYYPEIRFPEPEDLRLIDHFTGLSRIAIEREYSMQRELVLNAQLKTSNEKLKAFISVIPDLGLILDEEGNYIDIYGGNGELLVANSSELIGKNIRDVIDCDTAVELTSAIRRALEHSELEFLEYTLEVKGGRRVFEGRICPINHYLPEQPEKKHVLWIARDITEKKQAEENIERLAYYDPLTGLPNRRMFNDYLDCTVDKIARYDLIGALLFMDLDNFKRINDSLGHTVGDQLLVKIADNLKPFIGPQTNLSRLGGDEFVVLLESKSKNIDNVHREASKLAESLLGVFSQTLTLQDAHYAVRASIGICLIHEKAVSASEILKRADSAMYKAKKAGGNRYAFFDPELQKMADLQLRIERDIEAAISKNEFEAYFQPQLDMDGALVGAEALVRWIHPEEGIISPDKFIPIAEQTGAIHRIQEIVLRQSCELIVALKETGASHDRCTMAINISACQFDVDLEERIKLVVDEFSLPTSKFKLEITESMLMENVEMIVEKMQSLKSKGFRFSVDDFGTGYSSLAYLHSFPIDELKIDRSFINQIESKGTAIIDAIVSLSQSFGLRVVAEGVETREQLEILAEKNVSSVQGYYHAKPMPAHEFITWVTKAKRCEN
jgi:diguanylate cyclase (GGDEF)-like protein/PAS domain S-box-containing protein